MATPKKSLYEILGVDRDASDLDIGLAYDRRRDEAAKRMPPDANEIALVQQAYEVLSNPKRRVTYDASLVTAAEKAAAAEQPTDLLLEPETAPRDRRPIWVGAVAGLVALAAALYFTLRAPSIPSPPKEAPEPPKAVQAPPPPPKPLGAAAILAAVTPLVGQVLSYDMGGQAKPVGLAAQIDRGVFVTTCHGITAGSALVVRIGLESHSANLALADEELDLCKLSVPELRGAGIPIARDGIKEGDKVQVLGANAKGQMALTEAKVKKLRPVPNGTVIELDAPIAPNGSGGAVLDSFGQLAGIATTQHGIGSGLGIALPAAWLDQMRSRSKRA